MKTKIAVVALIALGSLAMGQKVKSKKEEEAVRALMGAQTPDAKIAAAEDLLTKYKDSEFKSYALIQAGQSAQAKGDAVAALQYGNRAIEAEPKNYQAMLLVASVLTQGTREFDLDRDEKLGRAAKLANDAIAALANAPKPNPALTDEQWNGIKKDFQAQAHDVLGTGAAVQKKYDVAVKEFTTSIADSATPDLTTNIRLASVYTDQGKFDESIAMLDKVISNPNASDPLKRAATTEKQRAEKNRSVKK
jgi:tetratricopeptide (TPR) repeat protein